jgi:glycosyltransferase involved in cell wall biosynthesis
MSIVSSQLSTVPSHEGTGVAVAIATAGRATQMRLTMDALSRLEPLPDCVLIIPATDDDFDIETAACLRALGKLHLIRPRGKGLTTQRNAALEWLTSHNCEVVVFFDDDFYPARDYVGKVKELFGRYRDAVAFTGRPRLDGATGPGISEELARATLSAIDNEAQEPKELQTYGAYGCNMSFRMAPIRTHGLRFDEDLPLYSWLEDIDFSRRIAQYGSVREAAQLRGIHLGVKGGRVSGVRFGYSQLANPIHCVSKGSMSFRYATKHILKNLAMNIMKSVWSEPWVDRRGRLQGNAIAVVDLFRRRMHPKRILDL